MDIEKMKEVIEKVKKSEASKEEVLALLKIMNLSVEAYVALIDEVKKEVN